MGAIDFSRMAVEKTMQDYAIELNDLVQALNNHCRPPTPLWLKDSEKVLLKAKAVIEESLKTIDRAVKIPRQVDQCELVYIDRHFSEYLERAGLLLRVGNSKQRLEALAALLYFSGVPGKILAERSQFMAYLFKSGDEVGLDDDGILLLMEVAVKENWYDQLLDRFYS